MIVGVPKSSVFEEETTGSEAENKPENKNKKAQIKKYLFNIGILDLTNGVFELSPIKLGNARFVNKTQYEF